MVLLFQHWAPELYALILSLPVYIFFADNRKERHWGKLSPLRLQNIGVLEQPLHPKHVAGLMSVAVFLGLLWGLANSYHGLESRPIKLLAIILYVYTAFRMISIDQQHLKKITNFLQHCRQYDVDTYRALDVAEILKGPAAAPPAFPRMTAAGKFLKDKEIKNKNIEAFLCDGHEGTNHIRLLRWMFVIVCVCAPVFLYIYNYGLAAQATGESVSSPFVRAFDATINEMFNGAAIKDLSPGAPSPSSGSDTSQSPFMLTVRFALFFFLSFAPLRYASQLFQYQLLGWRTRESGLGLEVDATSKLSAFMVFFLSSLIALMILKVDFSSLGLMTGFLAAGMSIAMRDTLGNLMAGMQLIWDRSLKKGDVITIPNPESRDTGSTYGIVEQIRMRYTIVQDRNTVRRLIPNHLLTANPIEHWTHEDSMVRLSLRIGVSYKARNRLREVQKIMESVCYDVTRVVTKKPPQALLVNYGDSAIIFSLRFWLEDARDGIRPVISDVLINLFERFDDAGIEIPYPQRDIHIKQFTQESVPDTVRAYLEGPDKNAIKA